MHGEATFASMLISLMWLLVTNVMQLSTPTFAQEQMLGTCLHNLIECSPLVEAKKKRTHSIRKSTINVWVATPIIRTPTVVFLLFLPTEPLLSLLSGLCS